MVVRTALVGMGRMGRRHLQVLLRNPRIDLRFIADPVAPAPPPGARARLVRDVAALDMRHLDLVVVAVPPSAHLHMMRVLADFPGHVLMEKPLCASVAEGRLLEEIFDVRRLRVGHVERFNPAVAALRALLRDGRLGQPRRAHFTRIGEPPPDADGRGGGVLDLGIHDIDMFRWLFGGPARLAAAHASRDARTAELLLTNGAGVSASLHCSWRGVHRFRGIVVMGTDGVATADLLDGSCTARGPRGSIETGPARPIEPLAAQLEAMLRCIDGLESNCATYAAAMDALRLAEEATRICDRISSRRPRLPISGPGDTPGE